MYLRCKFELQRIALYDFVTGAQIAENLPFEYKTCRDHYRVCVEDVSTLTYKTSQVYELVMHLYTTTKPGEILEFPFKFQWWNHAQKKIQNNRRLAREKSAIVFKAT